MPIYKLKDSTSSIFQCFDTVTVYLNQLSIDHYYAIDHGAVLQFQLSRSLMVNPRSLSVSLSKIKYLFHAVPVESDSNNANRLGHRL